jgi:hypothetical protein
VRALLYVLVRQLLHTGSMSLWLRFLHLDVQVLRLKVLEILVVSIEKMELNLVVEPIQEGILFLFIRINLIWCIS